MQALRTIYRYWTSLVFLGIVVQIGAAGYGAFYASDKADPGPMTEHQFDHGFNFHKGFGYIVFYATIVLFLLAVSSRLGRRRSGMALVLALLTIGQIALAWGGESVPVIGIFHPLVAFLVLGLSGQIAFEAWWGTRRRAATAS